GVSVSVIEKQLLRSEILIAGHLRKVSCARHDLCSRLDGLLQEANKPWLWAELLTENM
ncbi:MAG: hypothetical protein ACI91V_000814, partial [Lentimonas sp.]